MSDIEVVSASVDQENKTVTLNTNQDTPAPKQDNRLNRKQRRLNAKLARRKDLNPRSSAADAVKGMIKSMQESSRVQELVTSGKLDKWLS